MTDTLPTIRQISTIANALDEALEYFAQRMDCDDGIPNGAMKRHTEIEQEQEALKSLRGLVAAKPVLAIDNTGEPDGMVLR